MHWRLTARLTRPSGWTPFLIQTRFYRSDGSPVNHDPEKLVRIQDLDPWFEENACLHFFQESFASTKARIGRKPMMYETPRLESVNTDTVDEWFLAEARLEHIDRLQVSRRHGAGSYGA